MRAPILLLATITLGCGSEPPGDDDAPARVLSGAIEDIHVSVSTDLSSGRCERTDGAELGRPGLEGATITVTSPTAMEPNRQITALADAEGRLVYYIDRVIGRTGYTVSVDVAHDSAFVLDRASRHVARGSATEFRTLARLGPPDDLGRDILARCADR